VELVAARSDRVVAADLGPTTGGHRTIAAIVSAPGNIRNLERIRVTNQQLADPRTLAPGDARRAIATHKAVVAIGSSIHAPELGGTQAASELLYWLATATDRETLDLLDNLVVILIPSLNPDGQRLVADWYGRTKGTAFEGAPMPWLDHRYAGHDINRDAFMMNLAESRNLARFFYGRWHPQVFLSMHQMAGDGPRMTVPPMSDPIDRNYDPIIWREAALLGSAMALELQRDGRTGVASSVYDYYSPGYEDSAPLGHNTVCLLTEAAGVNIATPVTVSAADLESARVASPRMALPDPWPAGRWTLRDIMDYDTSAARGLLHGVSAYRERIVAGFYEMSARAVEAGRRGGPFAFVIPPAQHDPTAAAKLEELLMQGAVEIHRALGPFVGGATSYPAGTDIILLAQPYRAYVKTLLERQRYPFQRSPSRDASTDRPYDVAGWTLPAQMGVDVRTIESPFDTPAATLLTSATIAPAAVSGDREPAYYVVDARGNGGAIAVNRLAAAGAHVSWSTGEIEANGEGYPAGSLVVPGSAELRAVVTSIASDLGLRAAGVNRRPAATLTAIATGRIALYRSWFPNEDEGWTRWLLEQHEFRFATITDADIRGGNLKRRYDAILLPSASAAQMLEGQPAGTLPAEYTGGLGQPGVAALRAFVEAGGTLICLDQACRLPIEEFGLPVRDITARPGADAFFCPGSILALEFDALQPAGYGMRPHSAAFFASSSAFDVSAGAAGIQVDARYASQDLLISGWLEGGQLIAGQPAIVEVKRGAGRVVLLGFPVQHRGQTHATFRFLFNAIFTSGS
jgi:Zinc carboxypeptidase